MKDKYMLEINYQTAPTESQMAYFTSDVPFQPISKGDVINGTTLLDGDHAFGYLVKSVEHILWTNESGETKHKVVIVTERRRRDDP
jgi:hypothetical protein